MTAQRKPKNVVLIMTDNQQASTLACYGNDEVHTPHLDRFADQSVRFDNAYCPNAFCSPCRASILTGKVPSQHGVHSWIDDRKMQDWPAGWHALAGLTTLPAQMQSEHKHTALIGKYHLGEPTSVMPGFDHWVTLEDGHIRSFYNNKIFDNGEIYTQPGHSVDFFTDKAIDYIEQRHEREEDFFLFLPYPAPYGHWPATKEAVDCRHSERYADCPMDSVPRQALIKEAITGYEMKAHNSGHGLDYSMLLRAPNDVATLRNYYAQISMVDDGVGRVLAALDKLNLTDDTLIIFTADHGLSVGQHGFWGHGAATFPSNLHQAAHSVPMMIGGAGIGAGQINNLMVSNMDVYATILDYIAPEMLQDLASEIPSRSLKNILSGNADSLGEIDIVFSEQEETRVARTAKWAYFKRFQGATSYPCGHALYDVELDPHETENLIDQADLADVIKTLDAQLDEFFATYVREDADLWHGGQPIQNSERSAFWKDAWGEQWSPQYHYR